MSKFPKIAILLPTYNGARFLSQQLDSILAQNAQDFVIVTRDDGSGDGTTAIVQSYLQQYPDRIHVVEDQQGNLGASANVSSLMQYTLDNKSVLGLDRAYMMLCDQDDIWVQEKIAIEMAAMLGIEAGHPGMPVIVHSDLKVVSDDGGLIAESFVEYQGLDTEKNDLKGILLSNTVTGATALLNQELVKRALPVPDRAMMHDWWLALVASAFGRIEYVPQKLVSYRQHDQNVLGASEHTPARITHIRSWKNIFRTDKNPMLNPLADQARVFLDRYGLALSGSARFRLTLLSRLGTENPFLQRLIFRTLRL